jgi:hypothetical protein
LPLTHPESINTAMGPVCLERVKAAMTTVDFAETFTPIGV